jgi:hypothetical protein
MDFKSNFRRYSARFSPLNGGAVYQNTTRTIGVWAYNRFAAIYTLTASADIFRRGIVVLNNSVRTANIDKGTAIRRVLSVRATPSVAHYQ